MAIEKGTWAATAVSSEILAANDDRLTVIIQLHSGDITALGLGEAAVFAEGLKLVSAGDFIEIKEHQARGAIYAICDSGNSSAGGFQES